MTALARLLELVTPAPSSDVEVARRLAPKIPRGVTATSVEHGCVVLEGSIKSKERAPLVMRIASTKGVDAVVDMLTEVK